MEPLSLSIPPNRSEIAELAEGLGTSSENNSAISPGNVLGIVKMELGDFRKSLSGLEVKVERLGAAFDEKFSTVGSTTSVSFKEFKGAPNMSRSDSPARLREIMCCHRRSVGRFKILFVKQRRVEPLPQFKCRSVSVAENEAADVPAA